MSALADEFDHPHRQMEEVTAYVSRLKARRNEEAASRKVRSQRRADTVNANTEAFKQRSAAQRRRLMNEKLQMTSQIEHHLFTMLDEQSKWRHVMYQNVVDQGEHLSEMVSTQEELDDGYMRGLVVEEREVYQEVVKDDCHRWTVLETEQKHEYDTTVKDICTEVLNSVQTLAEKVIDFHTTHDLGTDPLLPDHSVPKSTFEAVPAALVRGWIDQEFYPAAPDASEEQATVADQTDGSGTTHPAAIVPVQEKMLVDHVSLRMFKVSPGEMDVTNGLFSGLTYKLQKMHQPDPPLFHPTKVRDKAIIVLTGPNFAGKSTTAAQVSQELGLWHLSDVDMIQGAMAEMEREIQDSDLQSPEEVNRAQLLDLGVDVRRALQEGQDVSDELIAALVLNHIDALELNLNYRGVIFDGALGSSQKVFELVENKLCLYNASRQLDVPDKLLAAKLPSMPGLDDPMFIVERPPTPPVEVVNPKDHAKKSDSKPTRRDNKKKGEEQEEPLPPIELPVIDPVPPLTEEEEETLKQVEKTVDKFGTHCTIHMIVDPEEVFRRFAGIRHDTESGDKYHMEQNPPPLQLMSRVAPTERADTDAVNLHVAAHNTGGELMAWVERYSEVATVNAQAPLQQVVSNVQAIAEGAVQRVQQEAEVQNAAEELLKNRAELEAMFVERTSIREGVRKQLAAIYTERGVDPLPLELQEVSVKPESRVLPVPPTFPAVFLQMLDDFTAYYKTSLCGTHAEIAKLVESVFSEGRYCMGHFDAFWRQPDTKQPILSQFCADFNLMQSALRRDVQGKDELHLRVDDLADQLAANAEKRRDEASTVIDGLLAHNAFVDHWCDAVRLMGGALIQLELERFFLVKQLAMLYYNSVKMETITVDEGEQTLEVLPMPRGSAADNAVAPPENTKEKKNEKKPVPKKGSAKEKERRESVHEEHSPDKLEDHFTVVIERAVAAMRTSVDRLTSPVVPVPVTKGDKKTKANQVEVPQTPELPPTGTLSAPIVLMELELAKQRMETIGRYIMDIIEQGHTRCVVTMKVKMQDKLRRHYLSEMAAANGVVFLIRTAIEEECSIDHQLCLDGATYAVDKGNPLIAARNPNQVQSLAQQNGLNGSGGSFQVNSGGQRGSVVMDLGGIPQAMLSVNVDGEADSFEDELDNQLTSALDITRADEMVKLFKTIAPEYLIYEQDFLTIVRQADYDIVKPCASPAEIFKRFDLLGCGAIDWREFMVHILFYLEPQMSDQAEPPVEPQTPGAFGNAMQPRNSYYVETPSLFQLFDFRNDIGMEPLSKEEYEDIPFFFEAQMEGERLENYRRIMWDMFAQPMTVMSQGPDEMSESGVVPETTSAPRPESAGVATEVGEEGGVERTEMMVDPNILVMFFCSDEQPLRGIQKAFAMGASVADENTVLTVEQVLQVFHFNACNAAQLGMQDPYDYESVLSIFQQPNGSVAETLSFPEACATQNGRLLLNNTYMYRQRSFLSDIELGEDEEPETDRTTLGTPGRTETPM